jgi:mannosyltransferase OCH1-like enzyme
MNIIQYWHAEALPTEFLALTDSFRSLNPEASYRLFNQTTAERFIAANFTPREVAAFRACAVPAMQSDYLRYCVMLASGGIYADIDMRCRCALKPLFDSVDAAELYSKPKANVPNGFFVVRQPGHPLMRCVLEVATLNIERRAFNSAWVATGPGILSALYWLSEGDTPEDLQQRLAVRAADIREPLKALMGTVRSLAAHRLPELMAGVRFSPFDKKDRYIEVTQVATMTGPPHWTRWQGSIYR